MPIDNGRTLMFGSAMWVANPDDPAEMVNVQVMVDALRDPQMLMPEDDMRNRRKAAALIEGLVREAKR